MGFSDTINASLSSAATFGGLIVATALLAAIVIWLCATAGWRGAFTERGAVFVLLFALALVGAVVGFATGLSRVGVVGNVIAAILALFGGLSVYVFGVDRTKGLIASLCIIAFSAAFFVQLMVGAGERDVAEARAEWANACLAALGGPGWTQADYAFKAQSLDCETFMQQLKIAGLREWNRVIPLGNSKLR